MTDITDDPNKPKGTASGKAFSQWNSPAATPPANPYSNTWEKAENDRIAAAKEAARKQQAGYKMSEDARHMIVSELRDAMRVARRAMRGAIKRKSAAKIGLNSTGEPDAVDPKELSLEHRLLAVRVHPPLKSNRDLPLQPAIMAEFDETNHGSRYGKEYLTENERKYFGKTEPADYVGEAGMEIGRNMIMAAYHKGKPPGPGL